MIEPSLDAPCIRQCCLDEHDVCMGCGRSLQEILDWHAASRDARAATLDRARARREARRRRLAGPGWRPDPP